MSNQDTLMLPEEISRRQYQERDNILHAGQSVRSYRVVVLTPGDTDWVGNGVRYHTVTEAREAAESLAWRWTAVRAHTVFPSADLPNTDGEGKLAVF